MRSRRRATAAAADRRIAAKCARTNQFNLGNFQVVLSKKKARGGKKKTETHSATISDVGPDNAVFSFFHDIHLQNLRPSKREQSAVVRDTVNIFDLIAI